MAEIKYKTLSKFNVSDILRLYENVGWSMYTEDIEKLIRALSNSHFVFTAWDKDKIVGLIRTVGDGESIIYIQDILVLSDYQKKRNRVKIIRRST